MADQPTGTVTFVFTDIEASTRLWAEDPAGMSRSVERHDEIVTSVIESNGGYVFATGGDGFSAAFPSVRSAVEAAVATQLAIERADWGGRQLGVRIGIHTGEPQERDGNYYGTAVNETARLADAGHGGQVLVSETAALAVGNQLPVDVELFDLGPHELKDVEGPFRIYQLTHPDLPTAFPALRSVRGASPALPRRLSSFVGRDAELRELRDAIATSRAVTLTGPGGSGKTSLAVEYARSASGGFDGGVWFIDLASVDDEALVAEAVASALVMVDRSDAPVDRLARRLRDARGLLLLDSCEHVIGAVRSLVGELLDRTEELRILATSREPLGIEGEQPFAIGALEVPDAEAESLEEVETIAAVRLFVNRAQRARAGFVLSSENMEAVGTICRRLDGLPLAIELAAARLNVLSARDLLQRLDSLFEVLTAGGHDHPARQQTLAATLDWSFQLLSDREKLLLGRLSVFVGGFRLAAVESICADETVTPERMLDLLSDLVDKSLVVADPTHGYVRFRFLEPVRQYAAARLVDSGEQDRFGESHAHYFRDFAVDAYERVWGSDESAWLDQFVAEWPNLRRSLDWHTDVGRTQDALGLAGVLYRFAFRRRVGEAELLLRLDQLLEADVTPSRARAYALKGRGTLTPRGSPWRVYFDEAILLFRAFGPPLELAGALQNAGFKAMFDGDWESARQMYTETIDIAREIENALLLGLGLNNLAVVISEHDQDHKGALAIQEEALAIARQSGSRQVLTVVLDELGQIKRQLGDLQGAAASFEESLAVQSESAEVFAYMGETEQGLAALALDEAEVTRAKSYLQRHAERTRPVSKLNGYSDTDQWFPLVEWARVAILEGRAEVALALLSADEAYYDVADRVRPPSVQADFEGAMQRAEKMLSSGERQKALATGRSLSRGAALDYAIDALGQQVA